MVLFKLRAPRTAQELCVIADGLQCEIHQTISFQMGNRKCRFLMPTAVDAVLRESLDCRSVRISFPLADRNDELASQPQYQPQISNRCVFQPFGDADRVEIGIKLRNL
jgi:hypothetical protein